MRLKAHLYKKYIVPTVPPQILFDIKSKQLSVTEDYNQIRTNDFC